MRSTTPRGRARSRSVGCRSARRWPPRGRWPIPRHAVAVLAALPAWTGAPDTAPAALGRAALRGDAAARRPGVGDRADAGLQPAMAGRRADPVLGRASGPRCPTPWTRPPVTWRRPAAAGGSGRADGRRVRDRRPGAPGRGRASNGWRPRRERRCAPSRSTRWARTPGCWARRAWPRYWPTPALTSRR